LNLVPTQPPKKLERPSIKVFEEDVDMELDNERKKQVQLQELEPPVNEDTNTDLPAQVNGDVNTKSLTSVNEDSTEIQTPADEDINTVPTTPTNRELTTITEEEDKPEETTKAEESEPAMETFDAAMNPSDNTDGGSRFYIKRHIIVGNVSQYIAPELRKPSFEKFTHRWMIYVTESDNSKESIASFVTCVRFHLHPSYKPHDVVDVTEAPFKLTRKGWGQFPIRIQLFFVDKKRNKTIDLIHHLKLDESHSGKQVLGGQRMIEIELDRNTDFRDTSSMPTIQQPQEQPSSLAIKQKMSLLGGILKECVRKLPIIRAGK
jgi:transcription initiation factor IIF auxiliary subunit